MATIYKFSRVHPPLMKDCGGDVYSVASELLREVIGTAKWNRQKPDRNPGFFVKGQVLESEFQLMRSIYWTMFLPLEHFAEDITKTVTLISGVSEIHKHTMERDLEVTSSASGFGLSASVRASLKITDEATREWHKEQKEERQQTFKAGFTYCTWMLVDELILKKTTQARLKGKPVPWKPAIFVVNSEFRCVLGTYQDKWEDTESKEVSARDIKLLSINKEHREIMIKYPTGKLALGHD